MSKVFGEQNPTRGEDIVSWQTFSDGAAGIPEIVGNADYGKLKLDMTGEEGRSAVYDLGSACVRKFTLTENRYGIGQDDATLQYRTDTVSFAQDDALPAWTTYAGQFSVNCRYVQIREVVTVTKFYYVDSSGDDGHDGLTPATAWQTIAKVNGFALNPGDHVLFKRGQTFAGQLAPVLDGTVDKSIVYGAYGSGERPIIDGSASSALYFDYTMGRCFLRYEHLDFAGCNISGGSTARAEGHDIYMYDCIFRDCLGGTYGFGFRASEVGSGAAIYNITVDSCVAYNNDATGFEVGSTLGTGGPHNCLIKNCIAYDNGTHASADHGFYVKYGVIVENCIAYNNYAGGIKTNCQTIHNSPYDPIVRGCVCFNNNIGFIIENVRTLFYNNLSFNNVTYAIGVESDDASYSQLYFNTFVNSLTDNGLIKFANTCVGTIWKNNIFVQDAAVYNKYILYSSGSLSTFASNNIFDYNAYYHDGVIGAPLFYDGSGALVWADWTGYGKEAHGTYLAALPDFVTRYTYLRPADGGNLKALGIAMAGFGYDKDRVVRANPPTPGCYETEGTELPLHLLVAPGDLAEDFENSADWTVVSSPVGGTFSDDAVHYQVGSKSLQIVTPNAAGYVYGTKAINVSCDGNVRLFVYCSDAAPPDGMTIYLCNDVAGFTNYFSIAEGYYGFVFRQYPGWNLFDFKTSDWSVGGGAPSWANPIRQIRVRVTTSAGTVFTVSVDGLYFNVSGQPAVAFTFDDGLTSVYSHAYAYMRSRNVRGTAYVISDLVGTAGHPSWLQLYGMYNDGWTIGNHTKDHTNLTTLTEAQQEAELSDCNAALVANGIVTRQKHVAYPGGNHNADTFTAMTAQGMLTGRTVHVITQGEKSPTTYPHHIYLVGEPDATTVYATAKAWIDNVVIARKEIGVICMHGLANTPASSEWNIEMFKTLVNYCIDQGVAIITMDDLYNVTSGPIHIPIVR